MKVDVGVEPQGVVGGIEYTGYEVRAGEVVRQQDEVADWDVLKRVDQVDGEARARGQNVDVMQRVELGSEAVKRGGTGVRHEHAAHQHVLVGHVREPNRGQEQLCSCDEYHVINV